MNRDELLKKASEFDYWFFPYDLGDGRKINTTEEKYSDMHYKKNDHILSPAINLLCKGNLKGQQVLDCGCNSGFFSFECAKKGADYVLGLEGQDDFLEQAKMLNDYFKYPNIEFRKMDLAEISMDKVGNFDIVLLMGVIYYLENPIAFFKEINKITKRAIVIDSETLFFENAIFDMKFQSDPPNRFGGLTKARLVPSIGAIKAMLYISGFKSFHMLDCDKVCKEYSDCRVALVASKEFEKGFESLEDMPFALNTKLGHFLPSDFRYIEKDLH